MSTEQTTARSRHDLLEWKPNKGAVSVCRREEAVDAEWSTAEAAAQLQQTFPSKQSPIAKHVAAATSSLKSKQYEKAYVSLQVLEGYPNLSYEQTLTVRRSIQSMQLDLANALLAGDPKARKLVEKMRRRQ